MFGRGGWGEGCSAATWHSTTRCHYILYTEPLKQRKRKCSWLHSRIIHIFQGSSRVVCFWAGVYFFQMFSVSTTKYFNPGFDLYLYPQKSLMLHLLLFLSQYLWGWCSSSLPGLKVSAASLNINLYRWHLFLFYCLAPEYSPTAINLQKPL